MAHRGRGGKVGERVKSGVGVGGGGGGGARGVCVGGVWRERRGVRGGASGFLPTTAFFAVLAGAAKERCRKSVGGEEEDGGKRRGEEGRR